MPRDPEFPALPAGNHTVTIQSAAISRRDGNLWVELEVGSEKGVQHDAMACGDRGDVRRLATIFEVAGVGLGRNADGGISEAALAQLVGKRIGVVVRREQILGYAPAARFAAGQTEGMPPTIRC